MAKKEPAEKVDILMLILNPKTYFAIWLVIICFSVILNTFVLYRFHGKTNETTAATAVVQEVPAWRTYTLQIEGTKDELQYKTIKKYEVGETLKGYYDGEHFLTKKQANKRGVVHVLIWAVPISILLFILIWKLLLDFLKAVLS